MVNNNDDSDDNCKSNEHDCFGVCDGEAWVSDCGCVAADNSGDDCDDCTGIPNGDNITDECGVCDADPSNDCVEDCAGTWGGSAVTDECSVCDADPSNDCEEDCAGVWGGSAVTDECGVCDDDPSNDCEQDCVGVWGGSAVVDECDVCDSDSSNDCGQDCSGEWGGDAEVIDYYDDFDGDGLGAGDPFEFCNGLVPVGATWATNGDDTDDECFSNFYDCLGVCYNSNIEDPPNVEDNCGVCDNDSSNNNTTCIQDCSGVWGGYNFVCDTFCPDMIFDCLGVCEGIAEVDECDVCNGSNECFDCGEKPNGGAFINACGICECGVDGNIYSDCVIDPVCSFDCSGTENGSKELDECGVCREPECQSNWINYGVSSEQDDACNQYNSQINVCTQNCGAEPSNNCIADCEQNFQDSCINDYHCYLDGITCKENDDNILPDCVQSCEDYDSITLATTEYEFCTWFLPLWMNGTADCVSEISPTPCDDEDKIKLGIIANICEDCVVAEDAGEEELCAEWQDAHPYYTESYSPCDTGYYPTNLDWNTSCIDCYGQINGDGFIDACGECFLKNDGSGCSEDCNGEDLDFGEEDYYYYDHCGICDNNQNNDCEMDCFGYAGGPAELDDCGICNGFNATQDCSGVCNGDAVEDSCGDCVINSLDSCIPDCDGIWGGTNEIDTFCYDFDGDGLGNPDVEWQFCSADAHCGISGGWCPDCSDTNDENYCPENEWDCLGVCNGNAEWDCLDECGGTAIIDDNDECCYENEIVNGICGGDPLSLYEGLIPDEFGIHNIYPNPFNPNANIVYTIPEYAHVKVTVYDLRGRTMAVLKNGFETTGFYTVQWDASEFASGVYFIEMRSNSFREIRKVLHMK